jgi:hypothetical protein
MLSLVVCMSFQNDMALPYVIRYSNRVQVPCLPEEDCMLISLLTVLAITVMAGIRASMADGPVVLEGPTTLELGLIGGGVILAYAIVTRVIWRRPASPLVQQISLSNEAVQDGRLTTSDTEPPGKKPSRGAA